VRTLPLDPEARAEAEISLVVRVAADASDPTLTRYLPLPSGTAVAAPVSVDRVRSDTIAASSRAA
jgi:hypothetical protein